jgi:serine/threonine protein kinase
MPGPNLSIEQVQNILPEAIDIEFIAKCGQKTVFRALIQDQLYALKFQSLPKPDPLQPEMIPDDVIIRAEREIETMRKCDSPYLVRMGPIGLQIVTIDGEEIAYYCEEFINGNDLVKHYNKNGNFSIPDLLLLGANVSEALKQIWGQSKIHRDIKPGNIMKRIDSDDFVLLDMGFLFDLNDISLSIGPVGTVPYFSPEQLDFRNRRTVLNFRSDLFSLGIVLYQMATGHHPFINKVGITQAEVCDNILNLKPTQPVDIRDDLPRELNDIIMRLLSKRPALRFRTIEKFQNALKLVE